MYARTRKRFLNKKAVTEVTSFILITMLVIIASISAYTYSKDAIDKKIANMDLGNSKSYLKKIHYNLLEIKNFNGATFGIDISFNKGLLVFNGSNIVYQSLIKYSGSDYCFTQVCYGSSNGYEKTYINLSSPYVFDKNLSLTPGNYLIIFKNIKNESKIEISIR
jgi:hypothetical protein